MAFDFFFLRGWKMEAFFFFSRRLSSSAVELESVEFSSSSPPPALPEKPPFSAATRMFPAFLRRSIEADDVSGGRGSTIASAVKRVGA